MKTAHWHFIATCAVRPDLKDKDGKDVGIQVNDEGDQQFIPFELEQSVSATSGWYNLWWAVCRNEVKHFY